MKTNYSKLKIIILLLATFFNAISQSKKSRWDAGQSLDKGTAYFNSAFRIQFQSDGNLVIYYTPTCTALFSTPTAGRNAEYCVMQSDGNFVIYDSKHTNLWSTETSGHPGSWIQLQGDGNFVLYELKGGAPNRLWDSFSFLEKHCNEYAPAYSRNSPCLLDTNPVTTVPMFEQKQPCIIHNQPGRRGFITNIIYENGCGNSNGMKAYLINKSLQNYKVTIRISHQGEPSETIVNIAAGGREYLGCTDGVINGSESFRYEIVKENI